MTGVRNRPPVIQVAFLPAWLSLPQALLGLLLDEDRHEVEHRIAVEPKYLTGTSHSLSTHVGETSSSSGRSSQRARALHPVLHGASRALAGGSGQPSGGERPPGNPLRDTTKAPPPTRRCEARLTGLLTSPYDLSRDEAPREPSRSRHPASRPAALCNIATLEQGETLCEKLRPRRPPHRTRRGVGHRHPRRRTSARADLAKADRDLNGDLRPARLDPRAFIQHF